MSIEEQYKQKIINLIVALHPQIKIYLFGSQATGTQVHGSDIDIALDAGKQMKRSAVGEIREVLNATDIPYKIDVVDLHLISEKMREMILKEGILWKSISPNILGL
jgi:uncharacterized protein